MNALIDNKEDILLYNEKKNCCGCGSCMSICPKKAITMENDADGAIYPKINENQCIKCGLCKKVCNFQKENEQKSPLETYAASWRNDTLLKQSASGGIFAALASYVLEQGGTVFGASLEYRKGVLTPIHIGITDCKDLHKLQGSKYVQSSISDNYVMARKYLLTGKPVLFSGTPCQIDGLKGFLGRDYQNLITLDIICHGVPSASFFQDYIRVLEMRLKGKIINFCFRDKTNGWGMGGKVVYRTKKGQVRTKLIPKQISSYYHYFLNSDIYRDSCYTCKYASSNRPADITVGDYWGVQREHPELFLDQKSALSIIKGISCIIINTEKGREYLDKVRPLLHLHLSSFEKVARGNEQLNRPSTMGKNREIIKKLYSTKRYEAVERYYRKQTGLRLKYYELKNMLPMRLKSFIRSIGGVGRKPFT